MQNSKRIAGPVGPGLAANMISETPGVYLAFKAIGVARNGPPGGKMNTKASINGFLLRPAATINRVAPMYPRNPHGPMRKRGAFAARRSLIPG
jgi:hypothetical protein